MPLFLEQFLVMLVGLADTMIVSYAGEAAVSGVSLVKVALSSIVALFGTYQIAANGVAQSIIWRERTGKWKAFQVIKNN